MIHAFGIDAGVLFHPGSSQALLAFVLERKRAVGIVKNAKHKEFVKQNLAQAVKTLGLAPDRRPSKPAELVAWETSRAVGGALPTAAKAQAAQPSQGPRPSLTVTTLPAPAPPQSATAPATPQAAPQAGQASQGSPTAPLLAAFGSSALR